MPPQVFVGFDQALKPGILWDTANWFVRWNNLTRPVTNVTTVGAQAVLQLDAGVLGMGPDVVSFSPPPFDIEGLWNNPVQAFLPYPLIVCP